MKKYNTYRNFNLPAIDAEILAFWQQNNIFERSMQEREGAEAFVFYEGPPSANGLPGIHHVLARSIKDVFCRFQTMKGKQVKRKAGWDTHGLPIELAVEKKLGISKEDIGKKISVEAYNAECRRTVMEYKDIWDNLTHKMGYWVDMSQPYITYENQYISSVWHLLQKIYKKGLLYKGYSIQPYSPAAGTGLSSHELNQPGCYKEVKDTTVVAMFKVKKDEKSAFLFDNENEDLRILAWTTTPWTLPSNTALTVGAKINYVKIKTTNPYTQAEVSVVLAEKLAAKWANEKAKTPILYQSDIFTGAQLDGIRYEQLLPFGNEIEPLEGKTDAFRVILGDFVTTEDGTGVVHTAPSFGADDRKAAKANGVGTLTLVDKQGKFLDTVGEFSGRYVKNYKDQADYKDVDIDIAIHLKSTGYAFNVQKYEHNYPHCWRTDKPVLYYPLDSWFIKVSAIKERMFELNNQINWKPAATGEGRFGNWLKNAQDWNLSRSRYWGIPLPIWRTENGETETCIGSVEELGKEIEKANKILGLTQICPEDLHRPFIDQIILVSDKGEKMQRETDLIDVWFDSGAMPYAQWGAYPEAADELKGVFPADFIAEGVDQTRGWFYTLHVIAAICFDTVAYKNVVSNGLVLDKAGRKMSKRWGNAVEPFFALQKYGADAVRWYMLTNAQPWDDLRFSWDKIYTDHEGKEHIFNPELLQKEPDFYNKMSLKEQYSDGITDVVRSFFGTLYNTYNFFAQYANVDNFYFEEEKLPLSERAEIDRWVISLLNTLIKEVEADYANYEPTQAGRKIAEFVDNHLSNWYVRLCRRRFWKGDKNVDKTAAYQTLYECLLTIAKLSAPIAPFYSDFLYRDLNQISNLEPHISVHLVFFPTADENQIDKKLEQRMDYAQRIASLVLSLRKREKIRVRQPLQKMLLPVLDEAFKSQVELVKNLILSEVNVKEMEFVFDTSGLVSKKIKPNFKTLGKKLGANMKAAQAQIEQFVQTDIQQLEKTGSHVLTIENIDYQLDSNDFIISSEDIKGWLVANDRDLTVALDVTISPILEAEGIARELVNRIQGLRKEKGFEITDRIQLTLQAHEVIKPALEHFQKYICDEVLATQLNVTNEVANGDLIDLLETTQIYILVERN